MSPSKKRKQSAEKHTQQQQQQQTTTLIRVHVETPDPARDPIVCSFPGGLPEALRHDTTTTTATAKQLPKFLWHGTSVTGQDHACVYTAHAPAEDDPKQRTKLCVGVYDKQTGTLTVHQAAAGGCVFALQQQVPAYVSNVRSSSHLPDAASQYRALFADFGSAKKLKVLKSQEANRVTVDAVVGTGTPLDTSTMSASNRQAVIERRAAAAAAAAATGDGTTAANRLAVLPDASQEATLMEWRRTFLPKFNMSAKDPVDVYDAADMAGEQAWGYISRVVTACWHKDDTVAALSDGRDTWTESVKQILDKTIPSDKNALPKESVKAVQHKLKCAVLLNHWVGLYNTLNRKRFIPAPTAAANSRYFGKPLVVAEQFLERFCTRTANEGSVESAGGYAMSKANKNSCVVHLLLLYMLADCPTSGGSVKTTTGNNKAVKADNIKLVADDLQLDVAEATRLLREAGVTVQRKNGQTVAASLTTPLSFPRPKKTAGPKR